MPAEARAQLCDVSGIVVIGDIHGPVRQLAAQARPLRLDWKPLRGKDPLWRGTGPAGVLRPPRTCHGLKGW